jgi:hypothetical protein
MFGDIRCVVLTTLGSVSPSGKFVLEISTNRTFQDHLSVNYYPEMGTNQRVWEKFQIS